MEVQISLPRTPYSLVKKTGIVGSILFKIQPTFSIQHSGLILTFLNHTHCFINVLQAAAGSLLAFLDLHFCEFFCRLDVDPLFMLISYSYTPKKFCP